MQPEFEVDGLRCAVAKDVGIAVWEDYDVAPISIGLPPSRPATHRPSVSRW
jgi:hypothetical protein